jgi:hypothetical protein
MWVGAKILESVKNQCELTSSETDVILNELITHQTPTFISRDGISCINTEFRAGRYLLLCELTCSRIGHETLSLNRNNSGSTCLAYIR